ncbi:MAG TPA: CBS domain-containing protein [Steroidobacteraceae bacterium]|nr:CBS domain-containing protein [Steroidobacteraceae bacterium]
MLISEICTTDVVCCMPDTTALEAARLMRSRHVGDVVVVSDVEKERVPVGVVTDRDLAIEVLGNGREAAIMPLSGLVRAPVVIAAEYEDVHSALERMRAHGVRRMPVVDDRGALVGIVTLDDLLGALLADMHALLETTGKAQRREQSTRR